MLRDKPVDIVLLDINMPGMGGIETCRKIRSHSPHIGILMVTHHLPDIIPEMRRVVLMRDGRVVGDGRKEEVLEAGWGNRGFRFADECGLAV